MARLINIIESMTIRTGKLIAVPLYDVNKHVKDWNWYEGHAFGIGTRGYCYLSDEDNLFHECRLKYDDCWDVIHLTRPRKIKGQFTPNHYKEIKKGGLRAFYPRIPLELKRIYHLCFEDSLTKKQFKVSNHSILDHIQPNGECKAMWNFNPYAVFGTGFKDWSYPSYVDVFTMNQEFEIYKKGDDHDDYQMYNALRDKTKHLQDLTGYTGINFNSK